VKVIIGGCWDIGLSTTEDVMNLCKCGGRFFKNSWFSKSLSFIPMEYCLQNMKGIYDNPKSLNKAIKLIKQELAIL